MPQNSGRSSAGIIVLVIGLLLLVPAHSEFLGLAGPSFYRQASPCRLSRQRCQQ